MLSEICRLRETAAAEGGKLSTETISRQKYGSSKVVSFGHDRAVERVKEELRKEGFGILAEIDIRKAMKEKLNVEYPGYLNLGACNPHLAHRALQAEPVSACCFRAMSRCAKLAEEPKLRWLMLTQCFR